MGNILKKSIEFSYKAHYSVSHSPTYTESEIWFVFHGYGQLAGFFIKKFQAFDSEKRLFIAPEGTNYAYLNGFEGRVGANWMTKHERETAILNNHNYLDLLADTLLAGYSDKPVINILGFSQGAATATRWSSRWKERAERLVLWSGGFAHDLDLKDSREKFADTELSIILGDQDPIITEESLEKQKELIDKLGKQVEVLTFSGGHELDMKMLARIIDSDI